MFIGLNYLSIERKNCPEHLNEIQKFTLVKLLTTKKRDISTPMVILDVPQENSQVDLKDILVKPNHLLLQDTSIDNLLQKIIDDCEFKEEIDKIEAMLDLPSEPIIESSNDYSA